MSSKLRVATGSDGLHLVYWCQGCQDAHQVRVGEGASPRWTWDGNPDAPTFEPSVLVTYKDLSGEEQHERCHTFVQGGMVRFLDDCTHAFAGQTLPLPDWPYADGEYGGVELLE